MKRWKKITLSLLLIAALSQAPFVYRRFQLRKLSNAISALGAQRAPSLDDSRFVEYRGVVHVHSFLGGHSTGQFEEIIRGAQANGLNFVVMTEHPSDAVDTAAMTLRGIHGGVLFLNGNEVSSSNGDRLLLAPGSSEANRASSRAPGDVASKQREASGLSFVAYPSEFKSWSDSAFDGVEVYNLFTNTKSMSRPVAFFDGLWSYRSYADLMFTTFFARPDDALKLYDEAIAKSGRRIVALAGNDAHANVGIQLADFTGKRFLSIQLDPYERSFRVVRIHVLIERGKPLNEETLLTSLAAGHCFIAFDIFGDTTGFSFAAVNGSQQVVMGDEIAIADGVRLVVRTPLPSKVALLKDGKVSAESGPSKNEHVFDAKERGVYRVEVSLDQLPSPHNTKPWIISNPIYVR